jgi:hypothetical protein
MPRSRNKYSRAQLRAKYRKPRRARSGRWFYATLAVVVALGVVGVVITREEQSAQASTPPLWQGSPDKVEGDHWHVAIGVNLCGQWINDAATFETNAENTNVRVGLHTHGDGFIHVHPFTRLEAGDNATLGTYFGFGGWSVDETSLDVWQGPAGAPSKTAWKNGDQCVDASGSKIGEGRLVWEVNCKARSGNPADYKLRDQEVLAIGFLPKGAKLGAPPHAASAPQNDGTAAPAIDQEGCRPSAVGNPGGTATTTTTAPTTTSSSSP